MEAYDKSIDRREAIKRTALLLGVAISSTSIRSALAQSAGGSMDATPRHLSDERFDLVSALAERILPRSDTPGALDVGVPEFIDLTYGKYMTESEMKAFAMGIDAFDQRCLAEAGARFAALSETDQGKQIDALIGNPSQMPFFQKARELTIVGFFTSEKVGKEVLQYLPVPGRFDACISLEDAGNINWSG